jgi:hypothetical protein
MGKYITQVKLANAGNADYELLDREMEKGRFERVSSLREAGKAEARREYNFRGVTTLQEVITAAYTAASRTGKEYKLTVIKDKG